MGEARGSGAAYGDGDRAYGKFFVDEILEVYEMVFEDTICPRCNEGYIL